MAKSHAPDRDTGVDPTERASSQDAQPGTHTEPMPPVSQLQDPQKDKLLPQHEEAIQKQAETRHEIQLTEMEKGAIRATVESWLQDADHNSLVPGSRHRLTLTISPEQRFISERILGEMADQQNANNPNPTRNINSATTGKPGLR